MSFLDEISWRGLLHQVTAKDELRAHLATPNRLAYAGFDPTADSLTIGNLVPIMLLKHLQRAGHKPVVLMGGGTGLIGDPSGKDSERTLQTREKVEANIAGQRRVFERFLDFSSAAASGAVLVNNIDWLEGLGFLEVLRTIGKHFSVNAMIQRDSVRTRLESREQGISYTEFSYMLLQAYDFLHLHRTLGVTVQMAGSDQYGNILGGVDLIRREGQGALGHEAFGLTAPLLVRADGKKFGKSEKGAVWLSADRTSPYAFYQFWINVDDADVAAYLKLFTFRSQPELEALIAAHDKEPHKREAQRTLALDMTELVHGKDECAMVRVAAESFFQNDIKAIHPRVLNAVMEEMPSSDHDKAELDGEGVDLLELLSTTTLVSSKREARQFLETGAVLINGEKAVLKQRLTTSDLLHGKFIAIKRGKKNWHLTRWN